MQPKSKKKKKKSTANMILNSEIVKAFPLQLETRQGCLVSTLVFNTVLKMSVNEVKKKRYKDHKGRNKNVIICR